MQLKHIETAHRFACAIPSAEPAECLLAVLLYHEVYGGGLRWFVLRNGAIEPRTPPGGRSTRYRFRLWSLCRLGVQCGVISTMPHSIANEDELDEDEAVEATSE